jgi:hypothetical protein
VSEGEPRAALANAAGLYFSYLHPSAAQPNAAAKYANETVKP